MDLSNTPRAVRHDGWTPARTVRFLYELAACGNVRSACSHAELSPEAAYKRRRRDALFARAWAAALVLGREASAEVLECRAIDGIEEPVWYRGEVVGYRRRYDTRLLLAHMARLDALSETGLARDDAARFDELLACVGGTAVPDDLAADEDGLPLRREACVNAAGEEFEQAQWAEIDWAKDAADRENAAEAEDDSDLEEQVIAYRAALAQAGDRWDGWTKDAYAAVDLLLAETGDPLACDGTPSTPSTSPPLPDGV